MRTSADATSEAEPRIRSAGVIIAAIVTVALETAVVFP
jgi:hypothetical protein